MEASCHTTVTAKTVELLKKKVKQGTNGVIDELKTYHGITATYEDKGKILTLHGDDDDILELAVYMLEKRAGVTSKNSKKELGGESTVKWTFTGREAVNIKRLFEVKTNNLEKNCNATVSKPKAAVETVIITCPYKSHTVVEKEIKHIEEALNKCLQVSVPISGPNHNQLAKQFAQKENDTFYCEYEKDQLIIWGKTQQNCDNGLEEWRNELDLLKPTKGAEDDNPTMSEKDNDNVTQQTPITDNGVKDNEANLSDNGSLGRNSPHAPVGEDVHDKVAGTSAMDIDKREVGKTIGSGKAKKYSFNVNGLNIYIYNTSITDMNGMDAITNAANEHMMHGGGVAYYISKAAGSKMDDDCKNYIKQHSKIPVTENYVSIPGKLKCKGIIHAVGPIWGDYSDKAKCAFELQSTILKVLEATRSKSWRKVAIPAISSGIFGVPKQLCAEMYVKSFIEYGHIFGDVVEVHFVDVNQEILDLVVKAHSNWANKTLTLEWDNAWKYVKTQSLTQRQGTQGSSEHSPDKPKLRFIGEQHTSYGERMFKYSVGDKLALRVYCGDLTKLKSVNVVAVPITNTEGGLMKVFEQLLQKTTYSSFVDRNCKGSTEGSVHVFEASKDLPDIANIVLKQKPMDMKTLSYAFKNLFKYKYKGEFVSLAVPLIGLGHIDTKRQSSVDELCECIINSILDVAGEKLSIREIHLVNKERGATDSIQTVLKRRTLSAAGHDKANSITQPHHKHAQQQQQQQYNTHYPDVKWNKHEPVDVKNYNTNSYAVPKGANCINHATREAVASLDCAKHYVCKVCQPIHNDGNCLTCKSGSLKDNKGSTSSNCPICQDVPKQPKSLPCKHVFCTDCYEEMIKHKPQCPICGYIVGIITGTQPPGDMFYGVDKRYHLPGFEKEKFGSILIRYKFPDGNQQKHHPKPGTSYKGIERVAYLPNNKEGNDVLQLLRIAFDRKLIFTIGDSTTTGKTGVITWNDIHHKTRPDGGPENFGYPDSTYPQRVREELTAKGVTLPTSGNKLYPDLSAMSGYGK